MSVIENANVQARSPLSRFEEHHESPGSETSRLIDAGTDFACSAGFSPRQLEGQMCYRRKRRTTKAGSSQRARRH
ncbi:hypothetical protein LAD59_12510 [Klebsiella pneumoniae]|nr:hypothetical protein [Klebsiella pneumoniae]